MDRWLQRLLSRIVRQGTLVVSTAPGRSFSVGDGTGEPVRVAASRETFLKILLDPELRLGEAFMDGSFHVERGSIADFLALVMSQTGGTPPYPAAKVLTGLRYLFRRIAQFNPRGRAKRNVAHHYDLDGRLYSLFLDADRQYSCAYFERPDLSLDDAQLAKKRHLAAKLLLDKPNLKVLDIGSGWGGLGLYLAEVGRAKVTGVTLSEEQAAASRARVGERRLQGQVDFRLQDYRDIDTTFDRIISVGMFEHVGVGHYAEFFRKIRDLLDTDGVAVIHSIGRSGGPAATSPWIRKYIFPGGYIPALSEVLPAIQRADLVVTDVEILRLHYAETLEAWRARFLAHREEVTRLYDERFCRMWEFYLAASEMSFRHGGMMIFQIQLARKQDAVPLTRDYIGPAETRLRRAEVEVREPMRLAGE
ncbi:MAG TPA: cyclopropane-fatty-acyl-phospholipid synthase family protein [Xanthobacteraceae bacterium]|nr:cyclopropane-fatty-acyl-phospholipid synthase family protein [Xanthobacteraceae bacterium]